jgi:polysaccharide biosynthesis protein PslH
MIPSLLASPLIPLTFRNYHARPVRDALERILSGELAPWLAGGTAPSRRPDWYGVVYDGLHPAIHSSRHGIFARPAFPPRVFYRAHNFETDLWERKAARTLLPPLRWFFRFQASRVRAFERSLLELSSGTAPVSEDDWRCFLKLDPAARGRVVPIGHDFGSSPAELRASGSLQALFLGRLDWPPNREGLAWFLEKVWPGVRARRKDIELSIAGSGDSSWLKPLLAQAERVSFLGRVESLPEVYERSAVSLVPIFYGSGTRVKVIEASRYGRACLSTALGVEGTGLEPGRSYLRAETEDQWIEALAGLAPEAARSVGLAAFAKMRETFDASRASEQFERLLDECA